MQYLTLKLFSRITTLATILCWFMYFKNCIKVTYKNNHKNNLLDKCKSQWKEAENEKKALAQSMKTKDT